MESIDNIGTPQYLIAYVLEASVCLFTWMINVTVDSLYLAFLIHVTVQLRLLARAMEDVKMEVVKTEKDEMKQYEIFKICVKYHNYLIGIVDDIQRVFALVFFSTFLICTIYLCADMYIITDDRVREPLAMVKYVCQAIFFTCLLFVFCYTGNLLNSECARIADDMYNVDWWSKNSSRLRHGVLYVIHRAQKPNSLKAAGILELNLVNFIRVIRLSFSIYTLLRAQSSRKSTVSVVNK